LTFMRILERPTAADPRLSLARLFRGALKEA
jgi:hypothetical protein